MATIKKDDQAVAYTGQLYQGLKKLPNHDDTPKNRQSERKLRLS
jgi:hypothetical protein